MQIKRNDLGQVGIASLLLDVNSLGVVQFEFFENPGSISSTSVAFNVGDAYDVAKAQMVPLPATLPMMIMGLALLASIRRVVSLPLPG